MQQDSLGLGLSGAGPDAVGAYEAARRELQCYVGDPVASAERAIAASPGFVMAHALRAWLYLLSTEAGAQPVARASWEAARALPADARERGHLAAIGQLLDGRWAAASRTLEDLAIDQPRDALALQVGHLADFYRGDARMLRDRIARALPHWDATMPGYHAILGMQAFGLEECGDYARAEAAGRRGVELERRDGWAQHAVAHVMEVQGRLDDGIAWMRATRRPGRRAASSASIIGGTSPSTISNAARPTPCWTCSTGRSSARARRSCSTCSTPRRCCGG